MKKVLIALGILLISFAPASTAYASSLNTYEKEILEVAHEIYEFNGKDYQVSASYINQLEAYLSSEEVDLTEEQRDEVLVTAFSNMEQGIKDGYLIPVQASDLQEDTTQGKDQTYDTDENSTPSNTGVESSNTQEATSGSSNQSGNTEETAVAGNTLTEANKGSVNNTEEAVTGPSTNDQINSETGNTKGSKTEDVNPSTVKDGNVMEQTQETASLDNKEELTPPDTGNNLLTGGQEKEIPDNTLSKDSSEAMVMTDDNIIKETGFDFTNAVIMIMGMGMLMLIGIYVTIKSDYFAHCNGS